MLLHRVFVLKVQQPLWAFISFKTSSIPYSCAEISWFIPFPVQAALCISSRHSSIGSSLMGGWPCRVAPRTPFRFEASLCQAAHCWSPHSSAAFLSFLHLMCLTSPTGGERITAEVLGYSSANRWYGAQPRGERGTRASSGKLPPTWETW